MKSKKNTTLSEQFQNITENSRNGGKCDTSNIDKCKLSNVECLILLNVIYCMYCM